MNKPARDLSLIDKPLYNYLQALVLAFYSNNLYVDVGKRWHGIGVCYLLLVTILFSIQPAIVAISRFNTYFTEQLIDPIKQIPPLYIQNGMVSLNKPMPYFINDKKGNVVIIIDTTDKITSIDNKNYPNLNMLITKNKFFIRNVEPSSLLLKETTPQASIHEETLDPNLNQVFDASFWLTYSKVNNIKYIADFIIYPSVVSMVFTIAFIWLLVFALMGQLLAKLFFNFKLSYQQAMRLLTVSSTPDFALILLLLILNWQFHGLSMLLLVLLIGYFFFAVFSLKRYSRNLVIL